MEMNTQNIWFSIWSLHIGYVEAYRSRAEFDTHVLTCCARNKERAREQQEAYEHYIARPDLYVVTDETNSTMARDDDDVCRWFRIETAPGVDLFDVKASAYERGFTQYTLADGKTHTTFYKSCIFPKTPDNLARAEAYIGINAQVTNLHRQMQQTLDTMERFSPDEHTS